jgi:hypothetical protein
MSTNFDPVYGNDPHLHLGKVGYNAYGAAAEWKNFAGDPMPQWDELPEHIRWKWRTAAKAIRFHLVDHPLPVPPEDNDTP